MTRINFNTFRLSKILINPRKIVQLKAHHNMSRINRQLFRLGLDIPAKRQPESRSCVARTVPYSPAGGRTRSTEVNKAFYRDYKFPWARPNTSSILQAGLGIRRNPLDGCDVILSMSVPSGVVVLFSHKNRQSTIIIWFYRL